MDGMGVDRVEPSVHGWQSVRPQRRARQCAVYEQAFEIAEYLGQCMISAEAVANANDTALILGRPPITSILTLASESRI